MRRTVFTALLAGALVLAACGDDADDDASDVGAETEATDDTAATGDTGDTDDTGETDERSGGIYDDGGATGGGSEVVATAETDLGEILVDGDGFTLYGFTNDTPGTSSCTDDCAATWPPLVIDSGELPEGLDADLFSVVERDDGSFQLQAGDWPLYTYAPDTEPGDTTGQDVGGVWYVVDPGGELIRS